MENKKILVVGAGGIGCELLKTLVLTGADDLTVVDLDLIDKSNLNRQFLFKRCDVGMPKALVAANVISSLRPDVKIQGMHQDIFKLKTDFFEGFDLIFNALDNLGARRYVNRNCVFLGKTFIDAGTQSKTGQVTVHIPKKSLCYDCMPKQSPKQYPVCTIRSTPSLIVHCIAWGKYLYEALFGPEDPSNILSELSSFKQNSPIELFNHLFNSDLPAQASPLTFPSEVESQLYKDQYSILSYLQLVNTFHFTFSSLKSRPPSPFDKNDNLAVHFVSSVSNLRALNFSIGLESMNKVQQIAGNIIPAIGSTNAIVAGLQVIEGIKVLNGGKNFGAVWVQESRSHNKYIFPTALEEKNDSVRNV
jgi:ubiquitin-like 1-activating enzyme E1 B